MPRQKDVNERLYRRIWRWHFYAAFLVIPFVLFQSVTGTLYLWQDAWADWTYPQLRMIAPQSEVASFDVQLAAAMARHPQARPTLMQVSEQPHRSTQILFSRDPANTDGLLFPVFVDPYSAKVLGEVSEWSWMPGWTRKVHGGWPLGNAGSWLLELGACWAVVMILSGLYLWWPRDRHWARALLPRLRQGKRTAIIDLHACVAVWFSLLVLVFLITALPWTHFWGNYVLKPVQEAAGQPSPFMNALRARSTIQNDVAPMSIDEAVQAARSQGVAGALDITVLGGADSALWLRNRMPRSESEHALAFDRYSRELLEHTTWQDYPLIPRAVAVGVDLHEGSYFGRSNQWLNTAVSLALVWTSVSGFISWWMRRPSGRIGAPARAAIPIPRWVKVLGASLCLILPLLALSILVLMLAERIFKPATSSPA